MKGSPARISQVSQKVVHLDYHVFLQTRYMQDEDLHSEANAFL